MKISGMRKRPLHGPQRQRGMIAMIIAIIVLVSTLLAVIGLMRSVDTSNLIAGTLSFRQGVLQEAERAYSVAKANIPYGSASNNDIVTLGYYASMQATDASLTDLPARLTSGSGIALAANASTKNAVTYVVERLCRPGTSGTDASKANCVVPGAYTKGGTWDEAGSSITPGAAQAAYRLSVRVLGPRNAIAYVQTIIR